MAKYVATRTVLLSGKRFRAGEQLPADELGEAGVARLVELGAVRAVEPEAKGAKKPDSKKPDAENT